MNKVRKFLEESERRYAEYFGVEPMTRHERVAGQLASGEADDIWRQDHEECKEALAEFRESTSDN